MQLPHRFGKYVLTEKIAQGGMAEIFKGQYLGESGFSKDVCIKRLLPVWSDNPQFIEMLIDEAKALVRLNHPNIVQVFELGRDEASFFISMELVEGVDLKRFFLKLLEAGQNLELKFIFYILAEILKGLDCAHQKLQIVHRDISPQNILISFDGRVKVTDFGIAKGLHRSHETTQAQIKGKYAYMSPEQARGEPVDARTDIYAVGILMFELLERRRLFEGVNDLAVLEAVRESRLPSDSLRTWPGALRAIVLTALQKDPRHRQQTARDFLEAIRHYVAKENLQTDAEELSLLLAELFQEEKKQKPVLEPAVFLRTVSKKNPARPAMMPRVAAFAAALFLCSFGLGMQSPQAVSKEQKTAKRPLFMPPLFGSIVVDAAPKPAPGELWINGKKEAEFVTPHQLSDIDLKEEKKVEIILEGPNKKKTSEKFVLNAANPSWAKTFRLEPPKPGLLKVAARPWGEVTIPGVIVRKETPVAGLSLQEGRYHLQVVYPPTGKVVEKEIMLASGARLICQADFGSVPKLVCK